MQQTLLEVLKNSDPAELKGFWEDLGNNLLGMVINSGNQLLQTVTLQTAIALANFGLGDGLLGKREALKDFWSELGDALLAQVITIGNSVLAPLTLTAAQLLAQFGLGDGLLGKREEFKGFWEDLGNNLLGMVIDSGNQLLQTVTLQTAIALAQFGLGDGIFGKRETLSWDEFVSTLGSTVSTQLQPFLQNVLSAGSLSLATWLANFGLGDGLFGKREELKDFWTDLGNQLLGQVIDAGNQILAPLTLTAAQLLAQFGLGSGLNGLFGKRELLKGFWEDLGNQLLGQVINSGNQLLQTVTLQTAIALANFGLGDGLLG